MRNSFCDNRLFRLKKIEVNNYSITADVSNSVRIVHISDLHNAEFGPENATLIQTIADQEPDLIFMTGDMINDDDDNLNIITNLIGQLKEIAPVYYGYGNHEVSWEKAFSTSLKEPLENAGAIVVENSFVDIDVNGSQLRIGGCMNYYRIWHMLTKDPDKLSIESAFAEEFEATDRYRILLNHIPTVWVDWNYVNSYNVDLVFTGHYHGGVFRIPIIDQGVYAPYVGWFPENTKGITVGNKATCVQSTGLGGEYLFRLYNPPEIVVVDVNPQQ